MKKIFWLTGLSGAGKSTLCEKVKPLLEQRQLTVKIIDGDEVRDRYPKAKGFERSDVLENNLNIAAMSLEALESHNIVLVPVIAPYAEVRNEVKKRLGEKLRLIYCKLSLDDVIARDVKGLYKKASSGEIKNMIGMSEAYPYEVPEAPDLIIESNTDINECVKTMVNYICSQI